MRNLLVIATLATLAGCARPAPRPPAQPTAAKASAAPSPASVAGPAGRTCSAPQSTAFTVVPQGGMGGTAEVQLSKDGRVAAAKPSPLEIQIWNVTSGNKVAVIAPGSPILQWALRPDGRMVAMVSEGRLSLVDPASRAAPIKVTLQANVERVEWRSDGKVLFATRGQETTIVDVAGTVTATIGAVSSAGAISADGRFLFSRDGAMWDVATNQSRWKATAPSASVAFSDDGQLIALASGQAITVLDSASGNKKWEVATKGGLGSEIALSPDGQSVAAYDNGESTERGMENRGMALWSRGKRMKLAQSADAAPATRPAFSPDGKVVAFITTSNGTEIRLADARTGARVKQAKNMGDVRSERPRWSADGRTMLQPSTNGLLVIDLVKGDRRFVGRSAESTGATTFYHDAVWSPDDGALLVIAEQGPRSIATIVDLKTGTPRETLDARGGGTALRRFGSAEWSAATGLIAIERNDGVVLWDGQAKQPARVVDTGDEGDRQIAFSPQGHVLATLAPPNKEARLWDPKTGARLRALTVAGSGTSEDGTPDTGVIEGMAFSADGARIALQAVLTTGVEQSTHIAIFDTATGALVRTLHAQRHHSYGTPYGRTGALHFTPQGRGIVAIDGSGRVDLWNTGTDDPPTPLIEKATPGPSTLADGGNLLLMGSPALDVWDLRTRTLTRELRGDGSPVLGARMAKGASAIAVTRFDRVDLHRLSDRASLTLRVGPVSAPPAVFIVADNGTFTGPAGAAAATAAMGPLRVRDGAEPDVRSLRASEVTSLYRPTLALDFVSGCP